MTDHVLSVGSRGVVYTETVVFSPPVQYLNDAPYQIAIVELDRGHKVTARIETAGETGRVVIADLVEFVELRDGVPVFRKVASLSKHHRRRTLALLAIHRPSICL